MPLILPGNVASATADAGYTVANSCRFEESRSTDLTRTPASAGNRRTWTYSGWHKVNAYNNDKAGRFLVAQTDSNNLVDFAYGSTGEIYLGIYEGGSWKELVTNAVHRDVSAWYHVVIACDTTQSTESNRLKLYVNGVQKTSFSTEVYVSQNYDTSINNDVSHIIGRYLGNAIYYNGYMAEVCLIDGQALTPTSFGEFDSASPTIWKPIDVSELTFGTNGFYLDFEDSADLGADVSGNSNDFTENNIAATDSATDTPTNNFATYNPLQVQVGTANEPIFREGNLHIHGATTGAIQFHAPSTIGVSAGKWYAEFKGGSASNQNGTVGVTYDPAEDARNDHYIGESAFAWGYAFDGDVYHTDSGTAYGDTYTTEIIGVALDLDNDKLYFSINGTFQNSGDPTSGATGTGAVDIDTGETYFFATGDINLIYVNPFEANFGGCSVSAISSGNADANGYGNFEYAVPSGYYALCTKNLAEYG